MTTKQIALLIVVGLVIGLGIGFPVAKQFQSVKTVTKTNTAYRKVTNGEDTLQMLKSFGSPAQISSAPVTVTIPAGCATFVGKPSKDGKSYKWLIINCTFER